GGSGDQQGAFDALMAEEPGAGEAGAGLAPSDDLFNAFALALTHLVADRPAPTLGSPSGLRLDIIAPYRLGGHRHVRDDPALLDLHEERARLIPRVHAHSPRNHAVPT